MPMPPLLPEIEWRSIFEAAWDYKAWRADGQPRVDKDFLGTFPEEKHEGLRHFLARNRENMDETDKTFELDPSIAQHLAAVGRPVHILCIAEDWCPDVVRHVPVLQKMADASPNVSARYMMRSDHLDAFARYLTVGGEAVPKFIFLSEDFVECGSWGPMPAACREMIARGRAAGDIKTAREHVSALYDSDPERRIVVEELLHEIDIASCVSA